MTRHAPTHFAIGLLCASLPVLAQYRMQTIASAGAWSVSAGQVDDGRNLCTTQAQGAGKLMRMANAAGDNLVIVQLLNTQWSGRAGVPVDLTAESVRLGARRTRARSVTTEDGTVGLHFSIQSARLDRWTREFERSQQMVLCMAAAIAA